MGNSAILNILVRANTGLAQAKLGAVDKQMKSIAGTSATTGGAMAKLGSKGKLAAGGMVGLGIAAGVAAKQLYDVGAELDEAYDKIRTGTGATGKQLEALKKDFRSVAGQVPDDFKTTGTAIADLNTRLGLTGKPLRKMSRDMLNLSRMTETDLQGNIKGVARSFVDWEVPMKKQSKTLNGFYRLSQASGMEVGELSSRIQEFGSPLRTLGYDVGEAASMFAAFERAGVNSATMLPGLKFAIKNIAKPAGEAAEQMDKLGIKTKDPAKGLREAFEMLTAKGPDALSKQEKINAAMGIFGQRAGPDMAEAIKQGRFELGDYTKIFAKGNETINKSARETRSAGESFAIFGNQLKLAVAPAAEWVHTAIADVAAAMVVGIKAVRRFTKTNEGWKDGIKVLGKVLSVLGKVAEGVWFLIRENLKATGQIFKGAFRSMSGVVEVFTALFRGDISGVWKAVKKIFSGGVQTLLGLLRAGTAPFRAAVRTIGKVITGTFRSAWDSVKGVFVSGGNAVIGVINKIIDAINIIPKVDIGHVGKIGGGGGGKGTRVAPSGGGYHFQRGGTIPGSDAPGDRIPALLEPGEYVLNRKAVRAVGQGNLDRLNFDKAPRFQKGGPVGMNLGGAVGGAIADAVGGAAGVVSKIASKGADFVLNKLPDPDLPSPFGKLGPWMIDKATGFIKDKVSSLLPSFGGGGGGDVDGLVPQVLRAIAFARRNGWSGSVVSGFRTYAEQVALYQAYLNGTGNLAAAPGTSNHEGGQAIDVSDTEGFARAMELMGGQRLHRRIPGEPWHFSVTGYQRGGRVRMKNGGGVNWHKRVGSHWDNNELASLAHAAGMAKPGLMAMIANGESSGNPKAIGNDPGGTTGLGLWQITTGYNDDVIERFGGRGAMLNPLQNAKAAKAILDRQGIGAWYAPPRGARGKVIGPLAQALRSAMRGGSGKIGGGKKGGGKKGGGQKWPTSGGASPDQPGKNKAGLAYAAKQRKKALAKIISRGANYPGKSRIRGLDSAIEIAAEYVTNAETRGGLSTGPGGSELTDAELREQIGLVEALLRKQKRQGRFVKRSLTHVRGVEDRFDALIKKATDKDSPLHWKLGAFRKGRKAARSARTALRGRLEGLYGLTGEGGEVFATRNKLAELKGTNVNSERDSEVLSLLREQLAATQRSLAITEAQTPIYSQFMPKYHSGGVVPGRAEQPIVAMGGEGIFTREQMAAMGGGGPIEVTVVVEDGAVDSSRIRAEVRGAVGEAITKTRTGRAGRKYVNGR